MKTSVGPGYVATINFSWKETEKELSTQEECFSKYAVGTVHSIKGKEFRVRRRILCPLQGFEIQMIRTDATSG